MEGDLDPKGAGGYAEGLQWLILVLGRQTVEAGGELEDTESVKLFSENMAI